MSKVHMYPGSCLLGRIKDYERCGIVIRRQNALRTSPGGSRDGVADLQRTEIFMRLRTPLMTMFRR